MRVGSLSTSFVRSGSPLLSKGKFKLKPLLIGVYVQTMSMCVLMVLFDLLVESWEDNW